MKDILFEIIENKRKELLQTDFTSIEPKARECTRPVISMSKALLDSKGGIIAEFKRYSPSKKWINKDANIQEIVSGYKQSGAAACSVLTDKDYFKGGIEYLLVARQVAGNMPLLRKDFIIDAKQIFEARVYGADAILLIAACLTKQECKFLADIAHSVGLEVLLEVHSEAELEYIDSNIDMVGVNNRNLGSFVTDVNNSVLLIDKIRNLGFSMPLVSESGIDNADTIKELQAEGFNGFLIGENFMKSENPAEQLLELILEL